MNYTLHSVCDVDDAIALIFKHENNGNRVLINGVGVKLNSLRLRTFLHDGTYCKNCGVMGKYFAIERYHDCDYYHINLYGFNDGREVMLTCDHILARCLGGRNKIENTQTLCQPCNQLKGKVEHVQREIQLLRAEFSKKLLGLEKTLKRI